MDATVNIQGSPLWQRMLKRSMPGDEQDDLTLRIWSETPWMVDARTGNFDSAEYRSIIDWCTEKWGSQASPIHRMPGTWQMGGVTTFGWTWIGFATKDMMLEFTETWECKPEEDNESTIHNDQDGRG
jgi:hypothetical protein